MLIKTIKVIVNCVFCFCPSIACRLTVLVYSMLNVKVFLVFLLLRFKRLVFCFTFQSSVRIGPCYLSPATIQLQGAAVICAFFRVLCLVLRLNLERPRILLTSLGTTRIAWYVSPFFSDYWDGCWLVWLYLTPIYPSILPQNKP